MESSALRSFHYSVTTLSHARSLPERAGVVPVHCSWSAGSKFDIRRLKVAGNIFCSPKRRNAVVTSSVKASDAVAAANSSDSTTNDSKENNALQSATFPAGFEALLLEVCDETEVAELKLKIGEFEMHVKRNVGAAKSPIPVVSPSVPPPIPSEPMDKSGSSAPPPAAPPKPASEKTSPFTNVSFGKSSRLAALEASGASGYVLVSSPTVGSFRRGRTLKGKKQPPSCKEGDVIKEGQVIGWLDQFGAELPVKSDVSGEVLKLLIDDGEPVGYGDPLIAVLPSFHGIQ
ncbi:uncharacterized protein LOC116188570 isoform X2 [Punica granatum]|uniref:Uncharacterized protein LOC116188570 isoform X2 n=1 Tax=Punica granatum TaxID=22663 RepID=A0A6P8BXA1_PUNGR|nr:uncharacterized protein LOC116188570 isoform X2 [Punica granatum]